MYKNGEAAIARVLELVNGCPKELQEKCFEVLLSGYVQLEVAGTQPHTPAGQNQQLAAKGSDLSVPATVLPRFKHAAKRLETTVERLESLFDFGVDPFTLQPVTLPGANNADKARELALLAASRSYLAGGSWSADWQEVKSLCVDHNCYDAANHTAYLKRAKKLFKTIEPGSPIELSSDGIKKAEQLLKALAAE